VLVKAWGLCSGRVRGFLGKADRSNTQGLNCELKRWGFILWAVVSHWRLLSKGKIEPAGGLTSGGFLGGQEGESRGTKNRRRLFQQQPRQKAIKS
jgi:hypothetical protein